MTDVTIVGDAPNGVAAASRARYGAETPDYFVKQADAKKNQKYAQICRNQGYDFTPCAFSTGGRPSPGAIRLFRSLLEAAGENVEQWYFYAGLLPRVFLALAIGQYRQDKVTHDEILACFQCGAPWPSTAGASPPSPAATSRPFADDTLPECDARWGPSPDGRCDFIPSRGAEYEEFLRGIVPDFFTAQAV